MPWCSKAFIASYAAAAPTASAVKCDFFSMGVVLSTDRNSSRCLASGCEDEWGSSLCLRSGLSDNVRAMDDGP